MSWVRDVRSHALALCALALLPAACAAPAGPAHASAGRTPSPPVVDDRTAPPTAAPAGPTECREPEPDAGPVDLVAVTLDRSGSGLVVTFDLRGPAVSSFADLQLSVGFWGADGAAQRSLSVRWLDGDPTLLAYDPARGRETELPGRPTVAGGTVTVRFPPAATAGLGPAGRWEAYASVDGTQVDECPSG